MLYEVSAQREKLIEQIDNDTVDWEKIRKDVSRNFAKNLEQNLKYIEQYGRENNLSEKEIQMLRETEIIAARQAYVAQRNKEASRTSDEYGQREIRTNNKEMLALNKQYAKREAKVGKHIDALGLYIEKQNKKSNSR